ncbi:MAG: class A beta-lactamase-related serine hydrolase [Candidatus Gastranaerophilales bacterium]|nr:class A beta-lactamase-related serine hydrolase [Candidatus Gastranaerophilales bacterium]
MPYLKSKPQYQQTQNVEYKTLRQKKQLKKKKYFKSKISLLITFLIIGGIILPDVCQTNWNNIFVNRIKNRNIKISLISDYFYNRVPYTNFDNELQEKFNFINRSEQLFTNDYIAGTKILGEVKIKKPEMEALFLTDEISILKQKLMNLSADYSNLTPGVFVWDFSTGKYVSINGDEIFPTASIIKIPILCQLFKRQELGLINLNDKMTFNEHFRTGGSGEMQYMSANFDITVEKLAELMIQNSDNSATNMLLSAVGGANNLNKEMRNWGLPATEINTWLPDLEGTNITTPLEMATILYNIDNPKFLSLKSRAKMIDIMSHVKNRYLIEEELPSDALFIHKTGNIRSMLGDSGIVEMSDGRKFIVVMMIKRPPNSYSAKQYIHQASDLIYNYFNNNKI